MYYCSPRASSTALERADCALTPSLRHAVAHLSWSHDGTRPAKGSLHADIKGLSTTTNHTIALWGAQRTAAGRQGLRRTDQAENSSDVAPLGQRELRPPSCYSRVNATLNNLRAEPEQRRSDVLDALGGTALRCQPPPVRFQFQRLADAQIMSVLKPS